MSTLIELSWTPVRALELTPKSPTLSIRSTRPLAEPQTSSRPWFWLFQGLRYPEYQIDQACRNVPVGALKRHPMVVPTGCENGPSMLATSRDGVSAHWSWTSRPGPNPTGLHPPLPSPAGAAAPLGLAQDVTAYVAAEAELVNPTATTAITSRSRPRIAAMAVLVRRMHELAPRKT